MLAQQLAWARGAQAPTFGLALLILALAGCGGQGEPLHPGSDPPPADPVVLRAVLRGEQERPPVSTTASGTATVTVDGSRTSATLHVRTRGLRGLRAIHLHLGGPTQVGPVLLTVHTPARASEAPEELTATITAANLAPGCDPSIRTFADAMDALLQGGTYLNLHTDAEPAGELRGHVGPARLRANLSGDQTVPPIVTTACGEATVELDRMQSRLDVTLCARGMSEVTACHIHAGGVGQSGPILFTLYSGRGDGPLPAPLAVRLTGADLTPDPGLGIVTFDDAVSAVLSGNTYLNVHSATYQCPAIRGHIVP